MHVKLLGIENETDMRHTIFHVHLKTLDWFYKISQIINEKQYIHFIDIYSDSQSILICIEIVLNLLTS